jgi:beta-1,4-mannosyltransferase
MTRGAGPLRLLVHAKSLRAALDWRAAVDAVERIAAAGGAVRLDLLVHAHAAGRDEVLAAASDVVRVRAHDPLPLDDLCAALVRSDALVLPYRWGTHSGLVELAADLGVTVLAADVGHLAEQVPLVACRPGVDGLAAGIRRLLAGDLPAVPPIEERARALETFRSGHARLYGRLCSPG